MSAPAIIWFRRDLRLADNEALSAAVARGGPVVPMCVGMDASARASRAWMAASLRALDDSLRERGSRLVFAAGPAPEALARLVRETGANTVHCTRVWSPDGLAEEEAAAGAVRDAGARLEVAEGSLLVPPDAITPKSGSGTYRVFGPYFDAWERRWGDLRLSPPPARIAAPAGWPTSAEPLRPGGDGPGPRGWWTPGETGAASRLAAFVRDALDDYPAGRDRPDLDGTSRLSPHLAFGEISPRQVAASVTSSAVDRETVRTFLRQLAWREFSAHVVAGEPEMVSKSLRPEFAAMPWHDDPESLEAWRTGTTGYPLVDAGMRQLAATGWMHNRVRMVVASLLTKHLLVHWREGLAHFADSLADHDACSNAFNWQWVAGSGADAAPYFRVFNPTLQAQRHDPDGAYIRRWVPELAEVPVGWIARPWEMDAEEARAAGVVIGETYPAPIVEHADARRRALAAYASMKG